MTPHDPNDPRNHASLRYPSYWRTQTEREDMLAQQGVSPASNVHPAHVNVAALVIAVLIVLGPVTGFIILVLLGAMLK